MGEILIMIIITIYLHSNKLHKVDKMKDLGVTFDPELSFNFHCEDKINKALFCIRINQEEFYLRYRRCICLTV